MYLQTLRQIILTFIEIICLSLLFEVNKTGAIINIFKFNLTSDPILYLVRDLTQQALKGQVVRIIRDCTCTHCRKNILSGLNCFQRLSADDTKN